MTYRLHQTLIPLICVFVVASQPAGVTQTPPPGFDVSAIYKQMFDAQINLLSDPETAKKMARFQKAYYDALVAEGFSRDEAVKIVAAIGLPLSNSR